MNLQRKIGLLSFSTTQEKLAQDDELGGLSLSCAT
jgi:hypothetical protein